MILSIYTMIPLVVGARHFFSLFITDEPSAMVLYHISSGFFFGVYTRDAILKLILK